MRRPIAETMLLTSLVGCALFWLWALMFGSITFTNGTVLALALLCVPATLGVVAFLFLIKRRAVGAAFCALFYAIQTIKFTTASGVTVGFNMSPTVYYRLSATATPSASLNVVALVFLILSLVVWRLLRDEELDAMPRLAA
jgi:hypothetical protein